jgi:hypothetical protein
MKTTKLYTWLFLASFFVLTCVIYACKRDNATTPDLISVNSDGTMSGVNPCATCVDQNLYKTVGNDNEVVGNVAVCQTTTQLTLTFTVSGDRDNAWFNQTGFVIDGNGSGFTSLNPSSLSREITHGDKIRSYTWTILLSNILKDNPLDHDGPDLPVVLGDKICIAAYAVVPGSDGTGGMVWAGQINPDKSNPNPRYFCYDIKTCETPPCPTSSCFFTQGYWFAKPNGSQWPASLINPLTNVKTITFGGSDYNYTEAREIFFSSNTKGKTDAKQAFLQGLAMKLNIAGGSDPAGCAGGTTALQNIETYFSLKPKQTAKTINSYPASSSLKSSATLLSNCFKANHCDNVPILTY